MTREREMANWLVTGAAGMLGVDLVAALQRGTVRSTAYCLVMASENSPLRIRTARPSAKRAEASSP